MAYRFLVPSERGVGKEERRSLEGTRMFLISIVGKPRLSQITAGLPFGNR